MTARRARLMVAVAVATGVAGLVSLAGGIDETAAESERSERGLETRSRVEGRLEAERRPVGGRQGPVAVLVELERRSTVEAFERARGQGIAARREAAREQLERVRAAQRAVRDRIAAVAPAARPLYRTHAALAGLAVQVDAEQVEALERLPGVAAVHPIAPKRPANATAIPLQAADAAWQGHGETGDGVSIAVIDTGIDYTHATFGGPGTPGAYASIDPDDEGDFVPGDKLAGGFDFAGDDYDAGGENGSPIPDDDGNPLDCNGHGTHVAGSAAGYGVTAGGGTYAGPWDETTPFDSLRIGPGVAPEAELYALKVFGCAGSTTLTGAAIEWAIDRNDNGIPDDDIDVINLSLGADFASPQDADALLVNEAVDAGIVVVASAGNGGDIYEIGGAPGNASKVIAVANGGDRRSLVDAVEVGGVPHPARMSLLFDWDSAPPLTEEVARPSDPKNLDGCKGFEFPDAAALEGKIAYLRWTDQPDGTPECGSTLRAENVADAGAVGFVLGAATESLFNLAIAGNEEIPGVITNLDGREAIETALDGGQDVTVTMGEGLRGEIVLDLPADEDKLASSSSRGTRGEGNLKPDLTAVGASVLSAAVGTGSQGAWLTGTSMASPMVAGAAALVLGHHESEDWTPEEVKAALVNTAGHDLFTGDNRTGDVYGPNRVGAGRLDVDAALATDVVAHVVDDGSGPSDESGAVGLGFGPIQATEPVTRTKTVRIVNKGADPAAYSIAYEPLVEIPGVEYEVTSGDDLDPADDEVEIAVPAGGEAELEVTLSIADPTALPKVGDPTVVVDGRRQWAAEASGWLVLTPTDGGGGPNLRLPVHSSPRAATELTQPQTIELPDSAIGTGTLEISGTGISGVGAVGSAFELQGTSPALSACGTTETPPGCIGFPEQAAADLRLAGAATEIGNADDPAAYFAITVESPWRTPVGPQDIEVEIDVDRDGETDGFLAATRILGTDILVAVLFDAETEQVVMDERGPAVVPLNGFYGDRDTAIFDSTTVVLPVPLLSLAELAGGPGSFGGRINWGVRSYSSGAEAFDQIGFAGESPNLSFDVLRPALRAADSAPASGDPAAPFFADTPGTELVVRRDAAVAAIDDPLGLMVVHHHDAEGEADVVDVELVPTGGPTGPSGPSGPTGPTGPPGVVRCKGEAATMVGTGGADVLRGTRRRDVIVALGGRDRIRAGAGNDLICAGGGRDAVVAGAGADRVSGGGGSDRIAGGGGPDRLGGDGGNDRLNGGGGRDLLVGGGGRDLLNGGGGRDRCRAGRGDRLRKCERR